MSSLRYAYNTNGCTNHRLEDAIALIAEAGYDGIALTLDWHHLDPFATDWKEKTFAVKQLLQQYQLGSVIETGARFLLNPKVKHEPTLINKYTNGRAFRQKFLKRAVDIAQILESETVSFWAGVKAEEVAKTDAEKYLLEGLQEVCNYAKNQNVSVAMEPEPGMLIEDIQQYQQLVKKLEHPLELALDIGHVWVTGELDPIEAVKKFAATAATISIEGMNRGVHVHLPLDQGDMDVAGIVEALKEAAYSKLICVELSRESHRAHLAIPESIKILKALEFQKTTL